MAVLSTRVVHLYNARVRNRLLRSRYLLIPLLAIAVRLLAGPRPVDDAFITFRYARNLLSGFGLVYNPGEWVLGTTTPLFALLLSGTALLTNGPQSNFPVLALIANSLFDALTCYILIRLGESLGRSSAGTASALIWSIAPMSVSFAIGGMETSLLVLLMVLTFYLSVRQRYVPAALFAGLSVITRPDAVLFIAPLFVERLIKWLRKSPSKPGAAELLSIALLLGVWIAAGTLLYGSPVPQSITAKGSAYFLPQDAALIRLLQHFATPFFGHDVFGLWWIGAGLLLFPTLFIVGWRRTIQEHPHAWPLAVYPFVYLIVFAIANPLIFRWYLTPPLPMYFMGIFLGVEDLSRRLKQTRLPAVAIVFTLALTINAWTLHPDHGLDRPAPKMAFVQLEGYYREAAQHLKPILKTEDTVAAGDIGVLGYDTGVKILDTVGLISPQSLAYYPLPVEKYTINYAIPTDLILDEQPEYFVTLEVYGRNTFLMDDRFSSAYQRIATIDTDIYGSEGMFVFKRR